MGITRVEVNEYTCELCGYKWINRVNGKDGPIPKRCAKCKHQHWEKGHMDPLETSWRDEVKRRFGYFRQLHGGFNGGWQTEKNVKLYLQGRPSVEEMKVLLRPMCYRYTYDESAGSRRKHKYKPRTGCVPVFPYTDEKKEIDWEATVKAHEYERELSRQLLRDLMTERGIPYDEKEAKRQMLYSRYKKYGPMMLHVIPEACDALKKDQPEWSNDVIRDKILREIGPQLEYVVESPEELIQSCWPDWLTSSKKK